MKFRFLLFSLLVAFSTISCLDNMQKANANTAEASEGTESETNADSLVIFVHGRCLNLIDLVASAANLGPTIRCQKELQ